MKLPRIIACAALAGALLTPATFVGARAASASIPTVPGCQDGDGTSGSYIAAALCVNGPDSSHVGDSEFWFQADIYNSYWSEVYDNVQMWFYPNTGGAELLYNVYFWAPADPYEQDPTFVGQTPQTLCGQGVCGIPGGTFDMHVVQPYATSHTLDIYFNVA